ncbi:MAG: hypothetical protein WAL32_08185, partial [Terriglobales bacterium]
MTIHRALAVLFSLILACTVFLPAVHADNWDQMTKMTFNEPVAIPGRALPAGTYWFVLQYN